MVCRYFQEIEGRRLGPGLCISPASELKPLRGEVDYETFYRFCEDRCVFCQKYSTGYLIESQKWR